MVLRSQIAGSIELDLEAAIDRRAPESRPGDDLVLRAEIDLVAVFSACPQDITPINGPGLTPRDAHLRIE